MSQQQATNMPGVTPTRLGLGRDWQHWAPYAAVVWSLLYAALGLYWAISGSGFPYAPKPEPDMAGSLLGRLGPEVGWVIVIAAGLPAAAMGIAMLRGVRVLRPVFITAGAVLGGVLLLLMIEFNLLILVGYIPYGLVKLLSGDEFGRAYLESLAQWSVLHQLLCLVGGFLWLAATVSYSRLSGDACLYCGRRDGTEGWNSPKQAARWGRIAVYVAIAVPVVYALTRYAWAFGIPLGMTEEALRAGQESGMWISGLFLANFGLVGAVLMLGLIQRWGEVFPFWMIGLAGRKVPIALAVIPAALVSVLFLVAGIVMWTGSSQMVTAAVETEQNFWIVVGPVMLFPVWGVALAVGTLGYYYRRRGVCEKCGRGG